VDGFDAHLEGYGFCLEESVFRRGGWGGHPVAWEESAEVEGDVLEAVSCEPLAELSDVALGVVEAGDQEIGDLEMDAGLFHCQDVVEDWLEGGAAVLAVEGVVHRLDVDVGRVEVGEELP